MLFFVVFLITLLSGAEVDLFIPSFPEMMRHFNITQSTVQFAVTVNFISYCIGSLFIGALGDRIGPKRVTVLSLILFTVGSFFCVFASEFSTLVFGRLVQGFAMSGPALMGYVIISKEIAKSKQASYMGVLNGVIAAAMAGAPIAGSLINMHFGWHGNFWTLLIFGVICLVFSIFFMPKDHDLNPNAKISLLEYIPLIQSKKYMLYLLISCLMSVNYWTFICLAPVLYMNDLGVNIEYFGIYQGIATFSFAAVSIFSKQIMAAFDNAMLYRLCGYLTVIWSICALIIGVFVKDDPVIITILFSILGALLVVPVNITWAASFHVIPGANSKASGLINFGRLVLTAASIQFIAYLDMHSFMPIAIFAFVVMIMCVYFMYLTEEWKYVDESKNQDATMMH